MLCFSRRISSEDVTQPEQARQSLKVTVATISSRALSFAFFALRFSVLWAEDVFRPPAPELLPGSSEGIRFFLRRLAGALPCKGAATDPGGGLVEMPPCMGRMHFSSGAIKSLRSLTLKRTPVENMEAVTAFHEAAKHKAKTVMSSRRHLRPPLPRLCICQNHDINSHGASRFPAWTATDCKDRWDAPRHRD